MAGARRPRLMRPLRQPGQSRIAALGRSAVCSAARATRSRRRVACRPGRAAGRCRPYRRRQGCDRRSVPTAPARPAGRTAAAAVQRRRHDGGSPACDGGDGCISVTANVMPGLCAHMHAAWVDGNLDRFAELRDALAPLHEALFAETNPIPVKAALELLGLCDAHARPRSAVPRRRPGHGWRRSSPRSDRWQAKLLPVRGAISQGRHAAIRRGLHSSGSQPHAPRRVSLARRRDTRDWASCRWPTPCGSTG